VGCCCFSCCCFFCCCACCADLQPQSTTLGELASFPDTHSQAHARTRSRMASSIPSDPCSPGVLVEEIDHFCPWTGTTIAKKNLQSFYVFVAGLFVQIAVLVVGIILLVRRGPVQRSDM
jgi:hypothetical protein